jgi:hypothetical protein
MSPGPVERRDMGGGRGLGMYGSPVADTYARHSSSLSGSGTRIEVSDSSAASYDAVWLRLYGEAHLEEAPRPFVGIPGGIARSSLSAHLDAKAARAVIERLQAWLDRVEGP